MSIHMGRCMAAMTERESQLEKVVETLLNVVGMEDGQGATQKRDKSYDYMKDALRNRSDPIFTSKNTTRILFDKTIKIVDKVHNQLTNKPNLKTLERLVDELISENRILKSNGEKMAALFKGHVEMLRATHELSNLRQLTTTHESEPLTDMVVFRQHSSNEEEEESDDYETELDEIDVETLKYQNEMMKTTFTFVRDMVWNNSPGDRPVGLNSVDVAYKLLEMVKSSDSLIVSTAIDAVTSMDQFKMMHQQVQSLMALTTSIIATPPGSRDASVSGDQMILVLNEMQKRMHELFMLQEERRGRLQEASIESGKREWNAKNGSVASLDIKTFIVNARVRLNDQIVWLLLVTAIVVIMATYYQGYRVANATTGLYDELTETAASYIRRLNPDNDKGVWAKISESFENLFKGNEKFKAKNTIDTYEKWFHESSIGVKLYDEDGNQVLEEEDDVREVNKRFKQQLLDVCSILEHVVMYSD